MKKSLLISTFLIFLAVCLSSCSSCSNSEKAPVLGAQIRVTVKNLVGTPQKDVDVYMFRNLRPDDNTDRGSAVKHISTNENGVAEFRLNLTELNITESQTPLYFAVYYQVGDKMVIQAGSNSVTVKRDQEKDINITIPM